MQIKYKFLFYGINNKKTLQRKKKKKIEKNLFELIVEKYFHP
jgi:hypothetical protein